MKRRKFPLIELLVVIAIIAIVANMGRFHFDFSSEPHISHTLSRVCDN